MKTLIIGPQYSEISIGGIERYIKNLISYCCQKNKEAIFLLPTDREDSLDKIGNVLIYKRNFLNLSYKKIADKKQVSDKESKEKARSFLIFLNNLFSEQKIDIVDAENFHTDLPPVYSLIINMVCFSKNIPLILRAHSFAATEIEESIANGLFWEKIICVSKSVAGDFFNKSVSINKLDTHYLGVDIKEFKSEINNNQLINELGLFQDSKIILHASRIIDGKKDILKEKGIIALLEAFSQLAPKNKNLVLLIAIARAPKKFKEEFSQALDKLNGYIQLNNLTGKVICKEFELEDMSHIYNGADVFVLASENETFGQVYIESMACGTPIIGTNVGGIPEVITDNYDGFLIEPNNPSLLMQKIEKLLYDENNRKEFIKNALKTVRRKFSTERQFMLLFNKLEKIVNFLEKSVQATEHN